MQCRSFSLNPVCLKLIFEFVSSSNFPVSTVCKSNTLSQSVCLSVCVSLSVCLSLSHDVVCVFSSLTIISPRGRERAQALRKECVNENYFLFLNHNTCLN